MQTNNETHITKRAIPGVTITLRDGYYKVRKIGLSARRVKTDPAFAATRKQAKEFGAIVKLTQRWSEMVEQATGSKIARRKLSSTLAKIVLQDKVNLPGMRNLLQGNGDTLKGLDLNPTTSWKEMIGITIESEYNPATQQIRIRLPAHNPVATVSPPPQVTHYRVKVLLLAIDAQYNIEATAPLQTTLIPVRNITIPAWYRQKSDVFQNDRIYIVVGWVKWYGPGATPGPVTIMDSYWVKKQ
ncbi:MAG: hypothetical protein DI539_19190 [Flavobacterium psychrophilum]|nr:MAG: hypothetical protein DI539_19190 [Flavobacterium psychrophilum]